MNPFYPARSSISRAVAGHEHGNVSFVAASGIKRIATAFRLRCPHCHEGKLFTGLLTMNEDCSKCGMKLEPEPGFYLGSVYSNYAVTVMVTTVSFVLLVFAAGFNKDAVLWGCVAFSVLFPLWFFRYARSIWLSLMYQVNSSDFIAHSHPSGEQAALSNHMH